MPPLPQMPPMTMPPSAGPGLAPGQAPFNNAGNFFATVPPLPGFQNQNQMQTQTRPPLANQVQVPPRLQAPTVGDLNTIGKIQIGNNPLESPGAMSPGDLNLGQMSPEDLDLSTMSPPPEDFDVGHLEDMAEGEVERERAPRSRAKTAGGQEKKRARARVTMCSSPCIYDATKVEVAGDTRG